jgi:hypothetical protein
MPRVLAVMLLAPLAARAEGLHVGLAAGAGIAQDYLGVHAEARLGHVELFAGTGLSSVNGAFNDRNGSTCGGVLGARWFSGDAGDRFFLSAQFDFTTARTCTFCGEGNAYNWTHFNVSTLTAGWRFKWQHVFADAGIGGGLFFKDDDGYKAHLAPDAVLAAGIEL